VEFGDQLPECTGSGGVPVDAEVTKSVQDRARVEVLVGSDAGEQPHTDGGAGVEVRAPQLSGSQPERM
jgi:hypothetical protein